MLFYEKISWMSKKVKFAALALYGCVCGLIVWQVMVCVTVCVCVCGVHEVF